MVPFARLSASLLVLMGIGLQAHADWSLVHPDREAVTIRQFIDKTGTRVIAQNRYARLKWDSGDLEVDLENGIRLPVNVFRYGETSSWFTKGMTVHPADGEPYRVFNLYHVPDTTSFDLEDFILEDYEVALPEGDWGLPWRVVDVSSDGRFLLFDFENLPYTDSKRLLEYSPETGWQVHPIEDGEILAIGGSGPSDLFAVVRRESVDSNRDLLFQLTTDGWQELVELAVEEINVVPSFPDWSGPQLISLPPQLNWNQPVPAQLLQPDTFIYPISSLDINVTESSVFIGDAPCFHTYSRLTGELATSGNFVSGRFYVEGEGESVRILVHGGNEVGYYDPGAETFSKIGISAEDLKYPGDMIYSSSSSEWIFNYNSVSVARTQDFLSFEEINPSFFGNSVIDIEPVGDDLYALVGSEVMRWSSLTGWHMATSKMSFIPGMLISLMHSGGVFYFGGLGEVYSTTDFLSFDTFTSDLLKAKVRMDIVDGIIVPVEGPVPVDRIVYQYGAFWVVLRSSLQSTSQQIKVLRSSNLPNWTLVGEWNDAVAGYSSESPFILIGTADTVHRIDMRSTAIEDLPLPEGHTMSFSWRLGPLSPLAGIEDEVLVLGRGSSSHRSLLRFRPESGWRVVHPELSGRDWYFSGATDRYHLEVRNLNNPSSQAETIHGDHFTWTGEADGKTGIVRLNGVDYAIGDRNEVWKRNYHPTESLLPDNQYLGDGWWLQDELGFLYYTDLPWVFSLDHGWWMFDTGSTDSWRVFDSHYGWLQTSEAVFPEFYSFREQAWIRYAVGSRTPDRWFYHHESKTWRKESGG